MGNTVSDLHQRKPRYTPIFRPIPKVDTEELRIRGKKINSERTPAARAGRLATNDDVTGRPCLAGGRARGARGGARGAKELRFLVFGDVRERRWSARSAAPGGRSRLSGPIVLSGIKGLPNGRKPVERGDRAGSTSPPSSRARPYPEQAVRNARLHAS